MVDPDRRIESFTDPKLDDWLRVYMLLHEVFRQVVPHYAQEFALGRRDPHTGFSPVRALFGGDRPQAGETVINGGRDYRRILDQPTGAEAFTYSPDIFPILGYCFTKGGQLPS
ncbi:hypothetical protein CVT24_002339 [Panaeolus cyanescens]|uniref:Uncharacterized protein n=1 Tax=Panaeolus cyanescens TaxID=181874 RepID=A0A409WJK8_9AGAR|nr:hypothetical protein CVT24_002339 [Panaeolus cyanescens]